MKLTFINRENELEFLEERYRSKSFECIVLYGKRRVGKTELIKKFLSGKEGIYFLCDKSGIERNMARFKKKIAEYLHEPLIETSDVEEIMKYLTGKLKSKTVIVFDEFSYLVEKDAAVPSLFQVIIDEILKKTPYCLILCGSSISMMEQGVLSHKSPLYGRKTGHWNVQPLAFQEMKQFFPQNTYEENIRFWSVLGGVPLYCEMFSDSQDLYENIEKEILSKRGRLYDEVDFILKEELRDPDVYKTILASIGNGNVKVVDIANSAHINVQDLDKYLKVLIKLRIIKKESPVTEKIKNKKTLYTFGDNFFHFWFTFCEPLKSDIEIENLRSFKEKFHRDFNMYLGRKFEDLCRIHCRDFLNQEYTKMGRWWGAYREEGVKKTAEIDIVAFNDKTQEILFGECKWSNRVNAESLLSELEEKTRYVDWNNETRKERFALFAKSFKKKVKDFKGKIVHCFDLEDIEKALRRK